MNNKKVWSSMQQVKRTNKEAGRNWFSPASMRFFKTRLSREIVCDRYFVSSERGPNGLRLYSIRMVADDASIKTIGKLQAFDSSRQAIAAIKKIGSTGWSSAAN